MSAAVEKVGGRSGHALSLVDMAERFALMAALLSMVAAFSILRPDTFFTWSNLSTILGSQAVLVVVTLGLIIPLTAGDFDLSIAFVLTLSQMMVAVLNGKWGYRSGSPSRPHWRWGRLSA